MPTRRCHGCGHWIDVRALFCPDCRFPMDPATLDVRWPDIAVGVCGALTIILVLVVTLWIAA